MELRGKQFEGNSLLLSKIDSGMLEVRTDNPSGPAWPGVRMASKYFCKVSGSLFCCYLLQVRIEEKKNRGESLDASAEVDFINWAT